MKNRLILSHFLCCCCFTAALIAGYAAPPSLQALFDQASAESDLANAASQRGDPAAALAHYVAALQPLEQGMALAADEQSSGRLHELEHNLREKAITTALKLPAPPAPPEAARHEVAFAMVAMKQATTDEDFQDAATHFQNALAVMPWLADAYYNLALVQEKLHDYTGAAASLRYYLLAAPHASDAAAVQNKLYELEYAYNRQQGRRQWLGKWEMAGPVKHHYVTYKTNNTGPIYIWVFVSEVTRDGLVKAKVLYDRDKISPGAREADEAKYAFYPYPFAITNYYGPTADEWRGTATNDRLVLDWKPSLPTQNSNEWTVSGQGRIEITNKGGRYEATLLCAAHSKHYRYSNIGSECDDSFSGETVRTATLKNPPKD